MPDNTSQPTPFHTVLEEELKQIDRRREKREQADPAGQGGGPADSGRPLPPLEKVRQQARDRRLVGLAFSGGGIRSATFNLGFLQGLAGLKLLPIFDYLSTVSGGGYSGSWLAAWMQRSGALGVERALQPAQVQRTAAATRTDLDPIQHLRRHSNYLAPQQGFLSADRWVLWAIYLRNFLLNQLVLLPAALIVLLVSRVVMFCYYPSVTAEDSVFEPTGERVPLSVPLSVGLLVAVLVPVVVALVNLLRAVRLVGGAIPSRPSGWLMLRVILPLGAAAIFFCALTPNPIPQVLTDRLLTPPLSAPNWLPEWVAPLTNWALIGGFVVGAGYGLVSLLNALFSWTAQLWCIVIGLVWGALLFGVYALLTWLYEWDETGPWQAGQVAATAAMTTFGPPLVLLTVVLALSLGVGLLRHGLKENLREWFASVCARLLVVSAIWIAVNLIALYATALVLWVGPWVQTALASGWLLTVASGVLAGGSAGTGGVRPKNPFREVAARLSLPLFAIGIFILVSLLVHVAIDNPPSLELAGEAVQPYRLEPEHPPIRVSVIGTGEPGNVTIQRKMEYLRIPDDAAAVRQRYWLGMLNTDKPDDVEHEIAWLNDDDLNFLRQGLGRHRNLLDRLDPYLYKEWEPDQFEERLRRRIGDGSDAPTRAAIARLAQAKGAVMFAGEGSVVLALSSLYPLAQGPVLAAAALHPKRTRFVFKLAFLDGTGATDEMRRQLKNVPFREWEVEEFQDKIDQLYPEAWHQPLRQLILQRAKGAGLKVGVQKGLFLLKRGGWLVGCLGLLLLAIWRVDVNAFSLHGLYSNRLIRCYLGASRSASERRPDRLTNFDLDDDLLLAELRDGPKPYHGPYPIINTALNLVRTKELAWQERKAESFSLTPLYCGSETTGYRPTAGPSGAYAGQLPLGTAVTISGAAASPNMGYHSSPAITFLLTVFNARLGAWLGNPKNPKTWTYAGPQLGFFHLLRELFGWTDDQGRYVYLSDGGHFENLGVYELVKRRCRYVVVCDAGQDENHAFEDLGNLIRKVRIDLGISIEVAPDFLRLQKEPRHSRWHCALGRIHYEDVDDGATPGTLVYVKPSLTGDEPADVLHYAAGHPTFPHETTANQFYTESQFESYRALGQHIAEAIFEQSLEEAEENTSRDVLACLGPAMRHRFRCRELFAALVRRWFAMPPEFEAKFVESTHGFSDVQEAFRNDARLWRLTLDLYPELDPAEKAARAARETDPAEWAARRAAELHILLQMLQVMENAYLSLNLEANYAHPMNRGWMDVFHRWTSAPTFRGHWPHLRGEFGRDFVRFCERQMRLGVVKGLPVPLRPDEPPHRLVRLLLEFEDQWPAFSDELRHRLEQEATADGPFTWAIYPDNPNPAADAPPEEGMSAGLILVWRADDTGAATPLRVYDLFVWLRGAYRNTGLGRPALRTVLEQLRERWPGPFRLRVRLPVGELTGPGGKLQEAMWLTFFHHLDFVRAGRAAARSDDAMEELELYRDFP